MIQTIQGNTEENNKILSLMLADQIIQARRKKWPSAGRILEELE